MVLCLCLLPHSLQPFLAIVIASAAVAAKNPLLWVDAQQTGQHLPARTCNYTAQECGGLLIPYPFGMREECGLPQYRVFCKKKGSRNGDSGGDYNEQHPYIMADYGKELEVLSFSVSHIIVDATELRTPICGHEEARGVADFSLSFTLSQPAIAIAPDNTFVVAGCGIMGTFDVTPILYDYSTRDLYGSCTDPCEQITDDSPLTVAIWSTCKVELPSFASKFITFNSLCVEEYALTRGYATIYHEGTVHDAVSTVTADTMEEGFVDITNSSQRYGLKLNWGLLFNESSYNCSSLPQHADYGCAPNSQCLDVMSIASYPLNINGYVCACNQGYRGDGYKNGTKCRDIDECSEGLDNCVRDPRYRNCTNTPGSFTCSCLGGADGNGIDVHVASGTGCVLKSKKLMANKYILAGVMAATLTMSVATIILRWCWAKHRAREQKAKNFKKNGGLQFEDFICSPVKSRQRASRIFSEEELKKATDNFSPRLRLGVGGHGTVYKGQLKDGSLVAIKKSFQYREELADHFINEIIILSQVNHRNIVQVLGCCLETPTPLLVYEYVPNGTLDDHLHLDQYGEANGRGGHTLDWQSRLALAVECAEALAYLHSSLSTPIIHRDIKSANILLDTTLTPKICDFGISRLVPGNHTHVTTLFQGTLGYLDPLYFKTSRLTDKSDVYSFGVVLLELVTSLRPINSEVNQAAALDTELPHSYMDVSILSSSNMAAVEDSFGVLVDPRLKAHENRCIMLSIYSVVKLAFLCIHPQGCNRPSMKELHQQLLWIQTSMHQQNKELKSQIKTAE